jgi:plastocyanin
MAAGTLFALRPQISGRTMAVALAVGGLLMFAGGLVAAAVGERTIEHHEEHDSEDFKDPVYAGEVFTGEGTRTYEFKSPGPGTYHFRCDVHPNMKGKVTVQ